VAPYLAGLGADGTAARASAAVKVDGRNGVTDGGGGGASSAPPSRHALGSAKTTLQPEH